MPYYTCEVTSLRERRHLAYAENSVHPDLRNSYYSLEIRCKVPNDDLRPWGRQLYGFLGIFYLPVLVDALWFGGDVNVQLVDVEAQASRVCEAPQPRKKVLLCYSRVSSAFGDRGEAVYDALHALRNEDKLALVEKIEAHGKAELEIEGGSVEILPSMVYRKYPKSWEEKSKEERLHQIFGTIAGFPMIIVSYAVLYAVFLAIPVIGSALLLIQNLVLAMYTVDQLGDRDTYSNNFKVCVQKTRSTAEDDEEVWELNTSVDFDRIGKPILRMFIPTFPINHLRPGDKIKVGFGPFEYLCLFRNAGDTRRARCAPPDARLTV